MATAAMASAGHAAAGLVGDGYEPTSTNGRLAASAGPGEDANAGGESAWLTGQAVP